MTGSRASTAAAGCYAGLFGSLPPALPPLPHPTGRLTAPSPHAHLSQEVPKTGHRQHHQNLLEINAVGHRTRSSEGCLQSISAGEKAMLRRSHQGTLLPHAAGPVCAKHVMETGFEEAGADVGP